MTHTALTILTLGVLFLVGLATDWLGRRSALPRVTLLLIFGVLIGPEVFNFIPLDMLNAFDLLATMTLLMVGFLLGGRLNVTTFRHSGKTLLGISLTAALGGAATVFFGLWALGVDISLALILGCIAAATDPAATVDTVDQQGKKGPFSELLLAIVAIDDAWALVLFSLGLAAALALNGITDNGSTSILIVRDLVGGIAVGLIVGVPGAYLSGRVRPGQPTLLEVLGLVFLCGGLALSLEVSFLLAAITSGTAVANLAKHHERPFHAIEGVEWPFMVIFFVLAGASLDFHSVEAMGWFGVTYVLCRSVGKVAGGYLGALLTNTDQHTRRWIGASLLPQAGAAMGMALIAATALPEYRQTLLSIIVASSVLFEIVGPIVTRQALERMDDY